jgi:hypothetical protein
LNRLGVAHESTTQQLHQVAERQQAAERLSPVAQALANVEAAHRSVAQPMAEQGAQHMAQSKPEAPKEAAPVPNAEAIEDITLKPNQHLEHSSWHNIVVGEDGKAVESIAYGKAYHQERQQEVLQDRFQDTGTVVTGTGNSQDYSHAASPMLPSGQNTQGLSPGVSPHQDSQHLLSGKTGLQAGPLLQSTWFWLGVGILLIAFFAAALFS